MILKKEIESLKSHYDNFNVEASKDPSDGYWNINNIYALQDNLKFFKNREIGLHLIEKIENYLKGNWGDQIKLGEGDKNFFVNTVKELKSIIVNIILYNMNFVTQEDDDFILIKIPDNVTDFEDLKNISDDLHKVFSQTIVNEEIEGKIDIKGAENGSIWLEIAVGSTIAVGVIGKLFYSALIIYREKLKNEKIKEEIRSLKIANDASQIVVEAFDANIKNLTKLEATNIVDEDYIKGVINKNEQIKRVELALNILVPLIPRGLQIEASSKADENTKKLFPKIEDLPSLLSRIKQIEN